jgi:uncharacterized membrane protein YagU involved in acid resistance
MIYILFSSYFAMVFVILNQIFKPISNGALILIGLILITTFLIVLGLLFHILKKNYDD